MPMNDGWSAGSFSMPGSAGRAGSATARAFEGSSGGVNACAGIGVLSAIGNTPLVRLAKLIPDARFRIYAKLETLNPGGSAKDRSALSMLRHALVSGVIGRETVVIESSSGNMGLGLAQTCGYLGLRFICVVDPKATKQNLRLLETYGAEVDLVKKRDPATGEFLQARLNRVRYLLRTVENSFWPRQYANPQNALAHHATMAEISEALDGRVDYLFCSTGTCGTLRGCSDYIHANNLPTSVVAVDSEGSAIFGSKKAPRLIPGHGAAVVPDLFRPGLADILMLVSDEEAIAGCRRLVRREALLAGGSSGAVAAAIAKMKDRIPDGAECVLILPDRGERYLDTIYCDAWVREHFGDFARRLKESEEEGIDG